MTLRFEDVPVPSELENVRTGYHSYSHAFSGMICMFLLFFGLSGRKNTWRSGKEECIFAFAQRPFTL